MLPQQLVAPVDGVELTHVHRVVDLGVPQEGRHDARPDSGDVPVTWPLAEDGRPFGVDGHDLHVGEMSLEPPRHPRDRPGRADPDEHVVQRGERRDDLARRQLVVSRHGGRVAVLIRPERVPDGLQQLRHLREASLQIAAGFVALVDTHDPGARALEKPPSVLLDVGIDDGNEAQSEGAAEHCERRGGIARGRLDDRRGPPDDAAPDGVAQHVIGGAILEAADDAVVLELGKEIQA